MNKPPHFKGLNILNSIKNPYCGGLLITDGSGLPISRSHDLTS